MGEPISAGKRRARLKVINPRSAGIDVGSRFHVVAVPVELDPNPVRKFSSFTKDLIALAEWLLAVGISTTAMESTGIYWVPLYEILSGKGIDVFLVNARHAKNVPGRKTDINDAQWLQQLHSYGLVRASFRPDQKITELRSYLRQRDQLVRYRSSHQKHIQKALMLMNLQLHHVVRDISGLTGRRIIDAILSGERDPERLASLRDRRCKESAATIAAALEGNYQDDHLFSLKIAVELFDTYSEKIRACELAAQSLMTELAGSDYQDPGSQPGDWKICGHGFAFNPTHLIQALSGHNLLRLPGLGPTTVLTLISECGLDMKRWPSAQHFVSWLGLSPQNRISGGKVLSSRTRQGTTRAGSAFWMAAVPLGRTNTALGAFQRRLAARAGKSKALIATARKLAILYYKTLRDGLVYQDPGAAAYQEESRDRQIRGLQRRAIALGFQLVASA
ncbi:IS110 family transposase [Synechococcus sp. CBW1002]|uniref:IS110 family transposase n=1 Tax=Synechococcus sp. CBW1002 TaxID=1353134 RepID=UPI0019370ED6|nr:IS110 family transposase [Synechococcus sp. CBW1002]QPN59746.1 IS110 family transposase [Synechococcus sp. CBW1002]